jgi:Zinc finger, C2H2 type
MGDTPDHDNVSASTILEVETSSKLRKHPAKFEYPVLDCRKRFARYTNLKAHIRSSHVKIERSFICFECDRRYARTEDRTRHVRECHNSASKQHVCGRLGKPGPEGCGQSFTRAEALRQHLRSKASSKCGRLVIEELYEDARSSSREDFRETYYAELMFRPITRNRCPHPKGSPKDADDDASVNGASGNGTPANQQIRVIVQAGQSEKNQAIAQIRAMSTRKRWIV